MPNAKLAMESTGPVKAPNSMSAASLQRTQKVPAPLVVLSSLPSHGTTVLSNSGSSALSSYSQKNLGGQVYATLQSSETNLFAMAKKITALMKKGPLSSSSSQTKQKKKTVAPADKNTSKVTAKQGIMKKTMTQGHTIFSVNPKYASNV